MIFFFKYRCKSVKENGRGGKKRNDCICFWGIHTHTDTNAAFLIYDGTDALILNTRYRETNVQRVKKTERGPSWWRCPLVWSHSLAPFWPYQRILFGVLKIIFTSGQKRSVWRLRGEHMCSPITWRRWCRCAYSRVSSTFRWVQCVSFTDQYNTASYIGPYIYF